MLRINYNTETGQTTMEEVEDIMIEESPVEPEQASDTERIKVVEEAVNMLIMMSMM